jgi:hypothetical protein
MSWKCCGFDFALVQHVVPLSLQWQLAQLFPVARGGSTSQCLFYISFMSMMVSLKVVHDFVWYFIGGASSSLARVEGCQCHFCLQ